MTKFVKYSEKNKDFFQLVYEVVKQIPHGRVTSYGIIARYLGAARSARMVGWAMNNAHNLEDKIPAHRVVNRNGLLTGKHHFGGENVMRDLLEREGIVVEADKVHNFDKLLWDPSEELSI